MRVGWIAVCALATVGGFLLALRLVWLLKVEPAWLPYPAHIVGALVAGFALGRQGMRSWREPALGGAIGVGIVAVAAFLPPHAFGWIVQRTELPWLVGPAIAAGCAAACAIGAWFAG